MDWNPVAETISAHTGNTFSLVDVSPVGGGCINAAFRLDGEGQSYFVKVNDARHIDMFEAEFAGLEELRSANAICVPEPICIGENGGQSWFAMEHIHMGRQHSDSQRIAGEQLAQLHRDIGEAFGWKRDNTIGSTHQENTLSSDWIEFWREHRLGFQLRLAAGKGYGDRLQSRGEKLLLKFDRLIDHDPQPSLLHGDLWGGNIGYDNSGAPVVFDPAVYYGDREADIAMTELFGGFGRDFYDGYNAVWPLDSGYPVRRVLYNLYHILNHLNLFGSGYAGQAQGMVDKLLAELG